MPYMKEQEINFGHKPQKSGEISYHPPIINNIEIPDIMGQPENLEKYEASKVAIAEELTRDISEITDEAILKDDLGADSLDLVNVVMRVEEIFNTQISDEEAEAVTMVKHIRDLFNVREAAKENPEILPLWILKRKEEIAEYKTQKIIK